MRVISIIVHLIALCDPALHKTTEEAAHPSLLNKRGVNFALLLSFSFSSAFFRSVLLHLQHVKSVSHNASAWNAKPVRCSFFPRILLLIFSTTLSFNYARHFLFMTHSLVSCSHCCPAIHPEIQRALVAALRESA